MVDHLHLGGFEFERSYNVTFAIILATGSGPGALLADLLFSAARTLLGEHHLLHHLAYNTVGEDHTRIGIFKCQVEAEADEVYHLLHSRGCKHDKMIVAMTATLGGLEIVGL